jgi:hypothetical protein
MSSSIVPMCSGGDKYHMGRCNVMCSTVVLALIGLSIDSDTAKLSTPCGAGIIGAGVVRVRSIFR